jgi:hypothetical protein
VWNEENTLGEISASLATKVVKFVGWAKRKRAHHPTTFTHEKWWARRDAPLLIRRRRAASRHAQGQNRRRGCDKVARRANHFRFTEINVKPEIYENQKYFAFPEM